MRQGVALTALVLAVLLLLPRRAAADTDPETNDTSPVQPQAADNPDAVPIDFEVPRVTNLPTDVKAFLWMIRACEHRYPRDVVNDACYNMFYGGKIFQDLADHPVVTGELAPVPLPDRLCLAAGLTPPCYSTAAGAYQFIRPTWTRLRNKLGLDDFSEQNQDKAALELLKETGIVDLIQAGEIEAAIRKASNIWASLPGSTAQQNPKAMGYALDRFAEGQRLYG